MYDNNHITKLFPRAVVLLDYKNKRKTEKQKNNNIPTWLTDILLYFRQNHNVFSWPIRATTPTPLSLCSPVGKKFVTAVAKHNRLLNTASRLFNKQADAQHTKTSYLISAWVRVRTHLCARARKTNRDNSSERSASHYVR